MKMQVTSFYIKITSWKLQVKFAESNFEIASC